MKVVCSICKKEISRVYFEIPMGKNKLKICAKCNMGKSQKNTIAGCGQGCEISCTFQCQMKKQN